MFQRNAKRSPGLILYVFNLVVVDVMGRGGRRRRRCGRDGGRGGQGREGRGGRRGVHLALRGQRRRQPEAAQADGGAPQRAAGQHLAVHASDCREHWGRT